MNSFSLRTSLGAVIITLSLFLNGCTTVGLYKALPQNREEIAQVVGFKNIRAWGNTRSIAMEKSAAESVMQQLKANKGKLAREVNALALSGGGADGAFGAGLLCGWTKAGNRPQFKLVSGISTGALIAPFAFLGPQYDQRLKKLYTSLSDEHIYAIHNPFTIIFTYIKPVLSPSLATNKPLALIIKKTVDKKMLEDIGKEHLKGRRLLIGTTQLNAQRLIIWDIGEIALSGNPKALALVHKILLASSALPGVFPPQYFTVISQGKIYKEMHVDGGVETQVMLFEKAITPFAQTYPAQRKDLIKHLYIIRNLKVTPEWENVKPRLHQMVSRVISTLTKNQGIGDLYRLYAYSVRDHIDYNLAFIPTNFNEEAHSFFDEVYMKKLFMVGYNLGKKGYKWRKFPPNFTQIK